MHHPVYNEPLSPPHTDHRMDVATPSPCQGGQTPYTRGTWRARAHSLLLGLMCPLASIPLLRGRHRI